MIFDGAAIDQASRASGFQKQPRADQHDQRPGDGANQSCHRFYTRIPEETGYISFAASDTACLLRFAGIIGGEP